MNIFNIVRRKLGLVTVPELQRVTNAIVSTIPAPAPPPTPLNYKEFVAVINLGASGVAEQVLNNTYDNDVAVLYNSGTGKMIIDLGETVSVTNTIAIFTTPFANSPLTNIGVRVINDTETIEISQVNNAGTATWPFTSFSTGFYTILVRTYNI
jgi:hypothetical protein